LRTTSTRATIHSEIATVLSQRAFPGNQYVLRVAAPKAAERSQPGMFAHIACDESIKLRRPLSIMRVDRSKGWAEFLYKPVGRGLAKLASKQPGDRLSILAPIGRGFELSLSKARIFAVGGGVGIPPMIFLADSIKADARYQPIVLMGSELPFPFDLVPSELRLDGVAGSATHSVALLEQWGIPSRLASRADLEGCHRGYVTELADSILSGLDSAELREVHICACGPEAMLAATARLAKRFGVSCDLCLEEYMACGVGGCAGCTVRVRTEAGPAMKRVCVDGPVFDSREIYPD